MKVFLAAFMVAASFTSLSVFADQSPPTDSIIAAQIQTTVTNKISLRVVKADSEEKVAEDGKASTIWHTQWQDASPTHPHEIVIELSAPAMIKGFSYLPRQDDSENGKIKDFEFFVSEDGKEFGEPVKKNTFAPSKDKKIITFEPKKCRYVKLKALSEVNGEAWTSAAEIASCLQIKIVRNEVWPASYYIETQDSIIH
jgi:hypothetical protein